MVRTVTYRQRDVAAALRAVAAAGNKAKAVEIDRQGKIVIVLDDPCKAEVLVENEWDAVADKI